MKISDPVVLKRTVKQYVFITFGLLLYAFAFMNIIKPAEIVGGGVTGVAMLVFYVTNGTIPVECTQFGVNAVLVAIAMKLIGVKFGAKTIYAIVMLPVCIWFMDTFMPEHMLGNIYQDHLLSSILAGAISGIGIAICFTQGGSTGGTDIIAMIINKYRNVSYGKVMMVFDFFVIGSSFFIKHDIATAIYSYIVVAVAGYTVDTILAGNRQSSQVFIISKMYDEVAAKISSEVKRGVTMLDGAGWYTKDKMKVVMVVCRKNETSAVFRVIKEVDPNAFITVGSVMGVYGLGFDQLRK